MNNERTDAFQAIADPSRRQILALLAQQSLPVNAIAGQFDMSRPAVSKHIGILCRAGFIAIEGRGRERYCSLRREGFEEVNNWLQWYERFWNQRVAALRQLLDEDFPPPPPSHQ